MHAAAQAEQQVQRALLRDVVVRERAPVLELLAGKDETLLVGRDACEQYMGAHVQGSAADMRSGL